LKQEKIKMEKEKKETEKNKFDLSRLVKGVVKKPRKLLLYGRPKTGKSPFVGSGKGVFLMYTENRVDHVDCLKLPVKSIDEIYGALEAVCKKEIKCDTIVIDTISELEPMLWRNICEKKGFSSLFDEIDKNVNFGRGMLVHAVEGWRKFLAHLDLVRDRGFNIVLVAHDVTVRNDPPEGNPYDMATLNINKYGSEVVIRWADVVAYMSRRVLTRSKGDRQPDGAAGKAIESDDRMIYVEGRNPAYLSGNSFNLSDIEVDPETSAADMEYLLTGIGSRNKVQEGK
jgi:hypothetical protein